ncbi:hypothetical protein BD410DRAFT_899027 [Rickenella mellea]|uniref:Uncharacterized protein n=1 Tax=Rickenella mellea TaxID=50990 RepID=A0A4Y7Q1J2_9AGAM|nr:hypothetical protein BD410DRAFT_899027 [Rickenella mellea]
MEGLEDLLYLLTRVKSKGWDDAFPDNPYQNFYQQDTSHFHPTGVTGQLLTFLQAIEETKACMDVLNEAQRRLSKRLRRLRRLSKPLVLQDGMNRLPDDVLAIIFEMTHHFSGDGPNQFAVCLSHVSRRFRSVALATPLLWTTIRNNYGENQIREFISRSGRLDLDIKMPLNSGIESFLTVLKDTSHRWRSLEIVEDEAQYFMEELGMTDLPRLRHITYLWPIELSESSILGVSQVEGWGWLVPARGHFQSNLTHVEFHLSEEDEVIEHLATTLHSLENLKDLSLKLQDFTGTRFEPPDRAAYPTPHSVPIDRLAVSILGEMPGYSELLFDALMHLLPSTVELLINAIWPEKLLFDRNREGNFLFPYGPEIKLQTPQSIDVMSTLADLIGSSDDIVKTVHFDTPMAKGPLEWRHHRLNDNHWKRIRSLDHLRFMNCNLFTEPDIESITTKLLRNKPGNGLQSMEIISCKMISEDFLLGLHDEVGDRLKWTL